ncbi:MAG: IS110 family transposase, partial [Jiangellaceae bacterium]
YYRRKLAAGKTKLEALRCLKRRISDAIYRQLLADAERAAQVGAAGVASFRLPSVVNPSAEGPSSVDSS